MKNNNITCQQAEAYINWMQVQQQRWQTPKGQSKVHWSQCLLYLSANYSSDLKHIKHISSPPPKQYQKEDLCQLGRSQKYQLFMS